METNFLKNFKTMKNTILKYIICFIALLNIGCEDYLEVESPINQYNYQSIFQDESMVRASMNQLYADLRDKGFLSGQIGGFSVYSGLYTDELESFRTNDFNTYSIYNNTIQANNPVVNQLWQQTYNQIYHSNSIIEGCLNANALSDTFKNQMTAEALFIRSLLHFQLVEVFNDIPFVTTTNLVDNSKVYRKPKEEIYQFIKQDLLKAINLTNESVDENRIVINKFVIYTLLARIELYDQNWSKAKEYAEIVNQNANYIWQGDISNEFKRNNKAIIWQLPPRTLGYPTNEGSTYFFQSGPTTTMALTNQLINLFETDDLRFNIWTRKVVNEETWYHAYKYKQRVIESNSEEFSVIFRLNEINLILAETNYHLGNSANAIDYLNKSRQRAGLQPIVNNRNLLNEILEERSREFFCEFGHRFFDLKRYNLLDNVLQSVKSNWKSHHKFWPIPEEEMLKNKNLTQNPGY